MGVSFRKDKLRRLEDSIDWSIRQMVRPRKERVEAIAQYVGGHYSDRSDGDSSVPVNYLELAVGIYLRHLAARAPNVIVKPTNNPELTAYAKNMEIAINQIPEEIGLSKTLRRIVMEAMFSIGVAKVGICTDGEVFEHDYGQVFVDCVPIDDYFVDMSAKRYEEIEFEGNDYWMPLDMIKNNKSYTNTEDLQPEKSSVLTEMGHSRGESVGVDSEELSFIDNIHLRDIWIPSEKVILTYAIKQKKLIRTVDWDGPEHGPYYRLGFSEVPGNILPLSPVSLWMDLHVLENKLFKKLAKQARNQKTVMGFNGSDEDVEAFREAGDGQGIKFTGQGPQELKIGSVDNNTLAFYLNTKDTFAYLAGNLDSLGGLSPTSGTVGQDKLLSDAASTRIKEMSERTTDFARDIFKAIAWYEWTDPIRERVFVKELPEIGVSIKTKWSPETREGDFLDYNFDIDVFSMQDNSPSVRLQKLGEVFNQYIIPLMPMIQQRGGRVDVQMLLQHLAKYSNLPELKTLVVFDGVPPEDEETFGNSTPSTTSSDSTSIYKPNHTTRTYERINRPGATRSGKENVLSQLLLGGNPQADEQASLLRSNG